MAGLFLCALFFQRDAPAGASEPRAVLTRTEWVEQSLVMAVVEQEPEAIASQLWMGGDPNQAVGRRARIEIFRAWPVQTGWQHITFENWSPLLALAKVPLRERRMIPIRNETVLALPRLAQKEVRAIELVLMRELSIAELGQLRIAQALVKAGANLEANDGAGMTPLLAAVQEKHDALALWLLHRGANPDVPAGESPLHRAVQRPNVLRALLEHGANPLAGDHDGETPLDWLNRYDVLIDLELGVSERDQLRESRSLLLEFVSNK